MKKRVVALILSLCMCLSLCCTTFATDEKVIVPLNPEDIVEYTEVLAAMPPTVLGTADMAKFDNSPNIQTRASGFLFSMRAEAVYELLITGAEKTFVEADLSNGYLYISGTLSHTVSSNALMKIGGCWYKATSGDYIADVYDYVYPGTISSTIDIPQYSFAKEKTHRGFIKNIAGSGYISGNLYFYSKA